MVYVFILFLCMISQIFVASEEGLVVVERMKVSGAVAQSPCNIALGSPIFQENQKFGFDIDGLQRVKSPVFLKSIVEAKKTASLEEARTMINKVTSSHVSLNHKGAHRLAQIAVFVSQNRNAAISELEAVYIHLLRQSTVSSWDLHYMRKAINELKK